MAPLSGSDLASWFMIGRQQDSRIVATSKQIGELRKRLARCFSNEVRCVQDSCYGDDGGKGVEGRSSYGDTSDSSTEPNSESHP